MKLSGSGILFCGVVVVALLSFKGNVSIIQRYFVNASDSNKF